MCENQYTTFFIKMSLPFSPMESCFGVNSHSCENSSFTSYFPLNVLLSSNLLRLELIPVSAAWSDQEYFYSPLDGMLVHCRATPSIKFAGTHLYTWVERGTVGVKCLAQEHKTMSPARARTQTARSRVERTNHEATAPPSEGWGFSGMRIWMCRS